MIRLLEALALSVGWVPPPPALPVAVRAEAFTEADCRRAELGRVMFTGHVDGRDGLGELYRVVLRGNIVSDRQWQALVTPDTWHRYEPGDDTTIVGVLTLHEVNGLTFATIHAER